MGRQQSRSTAPWHEGVTRYQWLVLVIASLGWVFDVFEGQIFVASMSEAMPSLVDPGTTPGRIAVYNNVALAGFLLGGAMGGIGFGWLSDRIGRKRTLSLTILFYSVFTCLSAFSQQWWHLVALRFLVALGVGGEWAVASALVAEEFPNRARPYVGSIFHASSVLGSYLATAAGAFLIGNAALIPWAQQSSPDWMSQFVDPASLPWRLGFALGVLPAMLVIWIRTSLREPEAWTAARQRVDASDGQGAGAIGDLFRGALRRRTVVGVTLATVGLATFWSVHIYGKDLLREAAKSELLGANALTRSPDGAPPSASAAATLAARAKRWEMLGMFLVTTGGGGGLLAFGPISQRLGRRGAFLAFQIGALAASLILFNFVRGVGALLTFLPVFGFLTLGMHAGFAIYFPELYPTRLRAAGAGLCFNAGRMFAAPVMLLVGWLREDRQMTLNQTASLMSLLFVAGILVLALAPETRGGELPE